ncbi:hypothetical protein [Cutibacterium avidum]|uniref:hypothetical protein n=1 Tax=Cutibacterium avidum TaxID=33010 RepID=UPI002FF089A4
MTHPIGTDPVTTDDLTPYDTGVACEPHSWIPAGTPVNDITPAENFGKVDFDDDEGATVCVVRVIRDTGGSYEMRIEPLVDASKLRVTIVNDMATK